IVLDVDRLKRMNDAHGHACGDRALSAVGEVLLDTCRSRDVPARLGGDEFGLILPRTRASEAAVVADRFRAALKRHRAELGMPLEELLSVSIGIADIDGTPSGNPTELANAADDALYRAKSLGRDRVE